MKSKEELKKELHALIDSIDDEETLNVLHDDLVPLVIESRVKESGEEEFLTPEQEKELEVAIKEADNGETISWEEFLNATKQWRIK
jgi:hypothetical protein